jgi:glycosyltransferase involved in cell wall biosynthesis
MFRIIYFKADSIIVLSSNEKDIIKSWGYKKPIFIESTVVDDSLIKHISKEFLNTKYTNIHNYKLLFLSRIEKTKGIYETIDAYSLLKEKFNSLQLIIAGVGSELNNVKEYVQNHNISDINFEGFVEGNHKIDVFKKSHIFIFPSYSEGMPSAVLEAFAFGLPVITRKVGGLVDIFQNKKNGFITESKNPIEFANYIERLLTDNNLMKKISLYNYNYAQNNFISPVVVKRLETIYKTLL